MSSIKKTIGNQVYEYDVTWDKKKKKQVWRYIGKVTNTKKESIGKLFTNTETKQIKEAYKMSCKNRYGKPRDTIKMICDKLNIKL